MPTTPVSSQPGEGAERRARSRPGRTRPRPGRPAAAPAPCRSAPRVDQPRDLGQRRCRRRPGVARTTSRPPALTVAPVDRRRPGRPRPAPPRRSAATRSTAEWPSTTTPSVAIFSPGRTTNRSPTDELADRHPAPRRRRASTATSLAPSSSSARSAAPGPPLCACLEVAAGEDERRDHRRHLEVELAVAAHERDGRPRPGRRASRARPACPSLPRRAAAPRQAARWNGQPAHSTTGVVSANATHSQPVELQRRHHGDQRATGTDSTAAATRRRRPSSAAGRQARRWRREQRVVAGGLDGRGEALLADGVRVVGDGRPLGRVVDRGLDAVQPVEAALDARRARRARHAGDRKLEPRGHASDASIPPMGITLAVGSSEPYGVPGDGGTALQAVRSARSPAWPSARPWRGATGRRSR